MNAKDYIEAIKRAKNSEEVLELWTKAASESSLSLNEIITVHKSCGDILADAAMSLRDKNNNTIIAC
tara:strand:+ start:80 stop:280 length:201 start_codon:yes stop_codon:yes gene_type:complete